MPKIKETKNRIIIHVGNLYKQYSPSKNWTFRIQDVGKPKLAERIAVKRRNKWQTYAWSFSNSQIKKVKKTLYIYDKKAYEILQKIHSDLKGYRIIPEFEIKQKPILSNPPHWYFPISYKEMRRRKLEHNKKALKKIGLTVEDLNKKYKPKRNRR